MNKRFPGRSSISAPTLDIRAHSEEVAGRFVETDRMSTLTGSIWDKTTFRVRKIPEEFDKDRLLNTIVTLFDLGSPSEAKVHSLAFSYEHDKVATVSFHNRPVALLKESLPQESSSWSFVLPESENGDQIWFDTHFRGFTPLSPTEGQKTQSLEYVHPKLQKCCC